MNTEVKSQTKTLTIVDSVRAMAPQFALLLKTSGTDPDKFMNNALLAINASPEIKNGEVNSSSVFNVCSRAANDGVVLDGKEAAIVIGWNGKTRQKEAQYRLMAGGVMKMIRRSPEINYVACQLVYEGDDCTISFVTDGIPIQHNINLRNRRGDILGVYFVAKLASGEWSSPEFMSVDEVNAVRDSYAQKNKDGEFSGMWRNAWGEAARKTILHRAKKRIPLSDDVEGRLRDDEDDILDHEEKVAALPSEPEKKTNKALDKVKATIQPQPVQEAVYEEVPHPEQQPETPEEELPI